MLHTPHPPRTNRRPCIGLAALVLCALAVAPLPAAAQALGRYVGTIKISYGEDSTAQRWAMQAVAKVMIPVTRGDKDRSFAQYEDPDEKNSTLLVTQYTTHRRAASPDTGGRISTNDCTLTRAVELPLGLFGSLVIDHKSKSYHMMFIAGSSQTLELDCVDSETGKHREDQIVDFTLGTHEAGVNFPGLPYTDAAHLMAKHTMVLGPGGTSRHVETVQEWDLQLQR